MLHYLQAVNGTSCEFGGSEFSSHCNNAGLYGGFSTGLAGVDAGGAYLRCFDNSCMEEPVGIGR